MSTSTTSETRRRLTPLLCVNCNAPLVVADAPSLVCRFCNAVNVVPQFYRDELRLTRNLDTATREAASQWLRLAHLKVPRWQLICAATAPFALLAGGLMIFLIVAVLGLVSGRVLPPLLSSVWLILIPAQLLAANVAMRNILVSGAKNIGAAFAASPPSAAGEPPNCRQCGAPLSVAPDDILVRCIYCEAESIVRLDEIAMKTLRTRVASAESSLAQAMTALTKHAKLASVETRGRTYVIAGLLVLPLIWSFVDAWSSSYWALLISLDVFVLAVCVFWNIREAFLPPVTIEELETLLGSSTKETRSEDQDKTRVAGTRGWYDSAFESVNFIVPGFVALIFVAIQIIALIAKGHLRLYD